uniref:Pectinacetylesterase family protein n=1 Tax=Strongyloides venezuelensis TaxID=75913 RepID=A0A0K0FLH7_STRVS
MAKTILYITVFVIMMHMTMSWVSPVRGTIDEEMIRRFFNNLNNLPSYHPKTIKRGCYINAGLSHGCDIANMMQDKFDYNKFQSFAGPGK